MLRVTGRRGGGGGPRSQGRDVEGNWPAGRRGWSALEQWEGVDLLLPVTLFVVADEMLKK